MKETRKRILFWTLMFLGALLILSRVGYSDGDDAFFYDNCRSMKFLEYLRWRYETWVGRLSGEAMVYLAFRQDLWFWRIVNAMMLVLLPIGIGKMSVKAAGVEEKGFDASLSVMAVAGYFLMAAATIGYAAVWVNGSIFYTWSFTCGIWALLPVADMVFETGKFQRWQLCYSIPAAVLASMSIEQMGAVLLTFEVLSVGYLFWKEKRLRWELLLQTAVTMAAFMVLFLAPGNDVRVASEITAWMPQYAAMSTGEHLFITVQWLLSSFANENKLFLCGIWIVGILLLLQRENRKTADIMWMIFAGVFTLAAVFPFFGVTLLSDMGMNIGDITQRVDRVTELGDLSSQNMAAMLWWSVALIFTFFFLWNISEFQVTLLLAYLAGIASEAILYCSPTMYASGARVYYLTDLLYLFLMMTLSQKLCHKKWKNGYTIGIVCAGIFHFVFQFQTFAIWL